MTSLERHIPQQDVYDDTEKIIALGLLIKDAKKSGEIELVDIYKERLSDIQQAAKQKEEEKTLAVERKEKRKQRATNLGLKALMASAVVAGVYGLVAYDDYAQDKETRLQETIEESANDDGFDYVSYLPANIGRGHKLTVAPSAECTVTTKDMDVTEDKSDIISYTFETSDGEVEVRNAEELIGRYGLELCQTTER